MAAAIAGGPADAEVTAGEAEPLALLATVATRHSAEVSGESVDAVRGRYGWTDGQLTAAFHAIAVRNSLERLDRLLAEPTARDAAVAGGRRDGAKMLR